MMKSMTGQGRGECLFNGYRFTVELTSVNRKQAEFVINLPRLLDPLESRIRELIAQNVNRGRVTVKVTLGIFEESVAVKGRLNNALIKAYVTELRQIAIEMNLDSAISLDTIVRLPGAFETDEDPADVEAFWPPLKRAVEAAFAGFIAMREKEGAHLSKDLAGRIQAMKEAADAVQLQAPEVMARYRRQLAEKLRAAGADVSNPDDDRLLKEIVIFADRSDIAEELARLESHFQQFEDCLKSSEPVGRTLDFLAQEMNREINTVGSKANDSVISRNVVVLKTELERFREQAQNVE